MAADRLQGELTVGDGLQRRAETLAAEQGVSVNEWLAAAVRREVDRLEQADEPGLVGDDRRIYEALRAAPEGLTALELAAVLGLPRVQVGTALVRLRSHGLVALPRPGARTDEHGFLAAEIPKLWVVG